MPSGLLIKLLIAVLLSAIACRSGAGAVQFLGATRTVGATVSPFNGTDVRPEDVVRDQRTGLGAESFVISRRLPDLPTSPAQFASASQDSSFDTDRFFMHSVLEYDDALLSTGLDSRVARADAVISIALDQPTAWRLDTTTQLSFRHVAVISHRLLIRDAGGTVVLSQFVPSGQSTFAGTLDAGQYSVEFLAQAGSTVWLPSSPQARYEIWRSFTLPSPSAGLILATLALCRRRTRAASA